MNSSRHRPDALLFPVERREEVRFRNKHSFPETRKLKDKQKNRKTSPHKHNLENKRTSRDTEDINKNEMTVVEKARAIHDNNKRHDFDGFGNIITNEEEGNTPDCKVTGDYIELEDLSKDIDNDNVNNLKWLYGNEQSSDIKDSFYPLEPGLSQSEHHISDEPVISYPDVYPDEERLEIEAEIKRKFAELEGLMDKIQAVKHRKRHRKSSKRRTRASSADIDVTGCLVNVKPIKRDRRLAQPIRNALLIRSAMKKAWKGSLGSCCGMGCWAHWKWVNIRHVISDYE